MNTESEPSIAPPRANKRRFFCQVFGCTATLPKRAFYKKNKICAFHANEPEVGLGAAGALMARFCQKCMRFQELSEFDGLKKSCRRSLLAHSKNRKRARELGRAESEAELAKFTAPAATSSRAVRRAAASESTMRRAHSAPISNAASSAATVTLDSPPLAQAHDPVPTQRLVVPNIHAEVLGRTPSASALISFRSQPPLPKVCSFKQTDNLLAPTPPTHDINASISCELLQGVLLSSGELSDEDFALLPPVVTLPECVGSPPPDPYEEVDFCELRRVSQKLLLSSGELHPDLIRAVNRTLN